EITLRILQILIAAEKFRPLTIAVFSNHRARHDDSRQLILWSFWNDICREKLLLPGFCQVSEHKDLRLFSKQILRGGLHVFRHRWLRRLSWRFCSGLLRGIIAAATHKHTGQSEGAGRDSQKKPPGTGMTKARALRVV